MTEALALDSSVLVLNRLYMAVHVLPARRAFGLLCKECAEVIDVTDDRFEAFDFESWIEVSQLRDHWPANDNDDWVHTISLSIRVPRIIRLLGYDRLPRRSVHFNRRNIFARDDNRCQYCGKHFPTTEMSLDHVIPRAVGGPTTWDNVVCACTNCNKRKGGRTPREAHMTLVRPPREPRSSPALTLKLRSPKYRSWKQFINEAYWSVPLK